ncbi:putative Glycosyl hydrolase family 31 [Leishmania utingensis]|uniref:Glycosyl hydrolase family 31 n=1 Tax=Leishmania utingensis TaxID=653362 RepID=A0AAW2ZWQ3_9TRYP
MAKHSFGFRGVRNRRSRHLLLRSALALAVLVTLSLIALLWFFAYESREGVEIPGERHFSPLTQHMAGEEVNADGTIPFRRPSSVTSTTCAPVAESSSGVGAVWFNPKTGDASHPNTSWLHSAFTSAGKVRVALPFGAHADTGAFVSQKPRLFAFLASWRAYERMLMGRGSQGDEATAAADVNEELPVFARWRVAPVKHVEVRLLRQRSSRNSWAAPTETMLPIVGILPRESTTLVSAEELLVESALSKEGLEPLVAAIQPGSDNKELTVVGIDTRLRASAAKERGGNASHSTGDGTSLLPFPLLELSIAPRHSATSPASSTAVNSDVIPATTLVKWRTGHMTAPASGEALEITLDIVHPSRPSLDASLYTEESEKTRSGARGDPYTSTLEANVCSTHIVRLYGLSPSILSVHTHGGSAGASAVAEEGGLNVIPLNMSEEVELMVGGETRLSSGGARLSGVVPLLYLELSYGRTVDVQQGAAAGEHQTMGLLWLHPGSFFISTLTSPTPTGGHEPPRTCVRLRGTAGATGLYLLPGPTPAEVLRQYYTLTGFPTLPPRFLLGYHHGLQGADVTTQQAAEDLSEAFRNAGVPLDSVWMTNSAVAAGDTPFTWNHTRFPDPLLMQSNLWYGGRRYVISRSVPTVPITSRSPLLLEGRRGGLFVSLSAVDTAGWPALSVDGVSSHVVDFFSPAASKWYSGMLKYRRYVGSSNHTFISLHHSAPIVRASAVPTAGEEAFLCLPPGLRVEGEVLPMNVGHHGGVQHNQVHQLLTVHFARATHEGMLRRTHYHRRALTFTESYFVGTQRYAVVRVETQPRCADTVPPDPASILREAWGALQTAVRQCAQLGVIGIPFSGANLVGGLSSRLLLLQQLANAPSTAATPTTPVPGVAGSGDGGAAAEKNGELTVSSASPRGAMEEMEQLLVRWYAAGVFFGAMYTDESAVAADTTNTGGAASLQPLATGPWWMRLPVAAATRQAIHANIYARYALLPYLYTAAYHASEEGSIFLAPLAFTSSEVSPPSKDTSTPTCYTAGSALLVCPVTQPVHPLRDVRKSDGTRSVVGTGFFDLWTGVWHGTVSSAAGRGSWWERAAQNGGPTSKELAWLATNNADPLQVLPVAASLAPVLLRSGHIVATQNVIVSRASSAHVSDEAIVDTRAVHSTHMGANWTITVALPSLPVAGGVAAVSPVVLAEGDVFWDEGSHNSQHQPPTMKPGDSVPPYMPYIPTNVHHCALHMKCLYEDAGASAATAQLTVEVTQTSESCAEALAELVSHWNEVPQGFEERLASAKAHRDSRLHQLEVEQNAQEDKGLRGGRGGVKDFPEASTLTREDLRGLRLPNAHDEATRNALWSSHILQRLRFLFQSEEDAARLSRKSSTSSATAIVVVERHSSTGNTPGVQAGEEGAVRASVCASHDVPDAHAVLVHLVCDVHGEGIAASVFGARKTVLADGSFGARVPPRHTWSFSFSLMN